MSLILLFRFVSLAKIQVHKETEVFFKIFNFNNIVDSIGCDTFRSIILNTNHAELTNVNCTASELKNAFEVTDEDDCLL